MSDNVELRNAILTSSDKLDYKVKGMAFFFTVLDTESHKIEVKEYMNGVLKLNEDGSPKTHDEYGWDIDLLMKKEIMPDLFGNVHPDYLKRVRNQKAGKTILRLRITLAKKFLSFLDADREAITKLTPVKMMWFGGKDATFNLINNSELKELSQKQLEG